MVRFENFDKTILEYDYDLIKRTVEDMFVNNDETITVNFICDQHMTVKI